MTADAIADFLFLTKRKFVTLSKQWDIEKEILCEIIYTL